MGKKPWSGSSRANGSLLLPIFVGFAVATVTDSVGCRAATSGETASWPTTIADLPLPRQNPKRKRAGAAAPAAKAASSQEALPPLPVINPLRRLKPYGNLTTPKKLGLIIPSLPKRGNELTNPVKSLAPLLQYEIASADINRLKQCIDLALKNRDGEALSVMRGINDRYARKLAEWYIWRKTRDADDPMRLERFRSENPDWPSGELLRRNVESALYKQKAEPKLIFETYRKEAPTTPLGMYLLAMAHERSGHKTEAMRLVRTLWHTESLGQKIETELLQTFGDRLTAKDHRRRADHFIYQDRVSLLPIVRRTAKLLDAGEQKKINWRMEVVKRRLAAAEKEFAKLGPAALKDTGLLFNHIQLLRRKKKHEQAWALLNKAPLEAERLSEPDEWWIERRVQIRIALKENKPQVAYQLASRHGEISSEYMEEAEFLAGWIALRHLKKTALAARHFEKQRRASNDPKEIARAEYWLGRAKLTQHDTIGALTHFTLAAKHSRTYYGQLALQQIEQAGKFSIGHADLPSQGDLKRFLNRDAVRALIIAHKAKLDDVAALFFRQLAWRLKDPGEMTLLAELALQIHSTRGSVITGKIGIHRGFELDRYAYPINALPHFQRLTPEVDPALILALVRQESEFNTVAHSHAGARGMMQIMPGTAKLIARGHNVRFSRDRLTSDPSYNVMLGVAHIHDLIKKYNGSYILTLVAYNAGPGRVRSWIEAFGDPRAPDVDPIDWVEQIPFNETRRYVQRILSSAQIFRHRLRKEKGQIRLVQDLNRGSPNEMRKADLNKLIEKIAVNR